MERCEEEEEEEEMMVGGSAGGGIEELFEHGERGSLKGLAEAQKRLNGSIIIIICDEE